MQGIYNIYIYVVREKIDLKKLPNSNTFDF